MLIVCIKSNITIKREIEGKNNLYSRCINCSFKNFETINKEELSYSLKIKLYIKMYCLTFTKCAMCDIRKSRFFEEQEASEIIGNIIKGIGSTFG